MFDLEFVTSCLHIFVAFYRCYGSIRITLDCRLSYWITVDRRNSQPMANNNKCSDKIIDGRKSDITKDLIIWPIQKNANTTQKSLKKNMKGQNAL